MKVQLLKQQTIDRFVNLILQTVFEHIGKALAILVTLDHIFASAITFHEHWSQYKRSGFAHIHVYIIMYIIIYYTCT